MDFDLLLVIGLFLAVLTIPSMLSAWVDGRPPRGAAVTVLVSGVLIVVALTQNPKPYTLEGLPHVVVELIGRYIR